MEELDEKEDIQLIEIDYEYIEEQIKKLNILEYKDEYSKYNDK